MDETSQELHRIIFVKTLTNKKVVARLIRECPLLQLDLRCYLVWLGNFQYFWLLVTTLSFCRWHRIFDHAAAFLAALRKGHGST